MTPRTLHRGSALAHSRLRGRYARGGAFTLVEVIVVIVLLGIAGAMVIPQMGTVGVLRVQAALRTVVSDITFAQADAIAFQQCRAVMFSKDANGYTLVQAVNGVLDPSTGTMYDPSKPDGKYVVSFNDPDYAGAHITNANFNGTQTLIFDDMGTPVLDATSDQPGGGGVLEITSGSQVFQIKVEAFTGRVTVRQTSGE